MKIGDYVKYRHATLLGTHVLYEVVSDGVIKSVTAQHEHSVNLEEYVVVSDDELKTYLKSLQDDTNDLLGCLREAVENIQKGVIANLEEAGLKNVSSRLESFAKTIRAVSSILDRPKLAVGDKFKHWSGDIYMASEIDKTFHLACIEGLNSGRCYRAAANDIDKIFGFNSDCFTKIN